MSIENLLRDNIKALMPYASARSEYSEQNAVLLDANESPLNNGFNRYPDPLQSKLKHAIADDRNVKQEQLFIGNGSDETLDLLIRAFCIPEKDNIVIMPPTYGMYEVLATINGVECKKSPLNEDFSLNIKTLFETIDKNTKIIFICSPNNPTGNSIDKVAIKEVLDRFTGLVVLDEAYIDFANESSFINYLSEYPYLFVNQTLSKSFSGAGLRLGVGVGSPELIRILNTIKPPYNVNSLSQLAGVRLINDSKSRNENIKLILKEKEKMFDDLKRLEMVKKIFPSEANFWLIRFTDAEWVYEELRNVGVIVRNRSNELHCENTLRITVGSAKENQVLLQNLIKINKKYSI